MMMGGGDFGGWGGVVDGWDAGEREFWWVACRLTGTLTTEIQCSRRLPFVVVVVVVVVVIGTGFLRTVCIGRYTLWARRNEARVNAPPSGSNWAEPTCPQARGRGRRWQQGEAKQKRPVVRWVERQPLRARETETRTVLLVPPDQNRLVSCEGSGSEAASGKVGEREGRQKAHKEKDGVNKVSSGASTCTERYSARWDRCFGER